MQDFGIVLEELERDVYLADSGLVTKSLMVATIYPLRSPQLVLTREISTPNATDAIVSYTEILGDTLEDWKRNLEETDLMLWKPLPGQKSGHVTS